MSEIFIPKLNEKRFTVKLTGETSLVMHKWSQKAKMEMLNKQMKKANTKKVARDPKAEFESSLHVVENGKFSYTSKTKDNPLGLGEVKFTGKLGIPASAVKKALVSAARTVDGITMTILRSCVFVHGTTDNEELIEIDYEKLLMREDIVRLGGIGRSADLRYRGEVVKWTALAPVSFDADVLSSEQVLNLIEKAGFACGLLEMRPEKTGLSYGKFTVKM